MSEHGVKLEDGKYLQIKPQGGSMMPFIFGDRDGVILARVEAGYQYKKNDILLYRDETGVLVLHRVHHVDGSGIYLMGDSITRLEGPYQRDDIIAMARFIIRREKKIACQSKGYLLLVNVWWKLLPIRPFLTRVLYSRPIIRFLYRGYPLPSIKGLT